MIPLTINECVAATGGTLLNCPDSELSILTVVTDSRVDCNGGLFIALRGERFDGHDFVEHIVGHGAVLACVDSAFSTQNPIPMLVVEDTVKAYQDLARYYRQKLGITVVAVTGSSGKTSTKEILASVLAEKWGEGAVYATKANTNNHIGVPQNIFNLSDKHSVCILEMGTNHPGEIATLTRIGMPDIAIVTSIGAGHVEFLGSVEGVALEKSSIFSTLQSEGVAIYPLNTEYTSILDEASSHARQVIVGEDLVGEYRGGTLEGSSFSYMLDGESHYIEWPLHGKHQCENALLAIACAITLELTHEQILCGLQKASLSGMRMRVTEHNGVVWINDAYNANPDSVLAGIDWLAEVVGDSMPVYLVLGDMLELGEDAPRYHRKVIAHSRWKLPDAVRCLVGPIMTNAAGGEELYCFSDVSSVISCVKELISDSDGKCIVYLKGSRGMRLEVIEKECCG